MNQPGDATSGRKLGKAILLAMLVPLALFMLLFPPTSLSMIGIYGVVAVVSLPFTLGALVILGMPAYILLGRLGIRNLLTLAIVGLFGGAGAALLFGYSIDSTDWSTLGYLAASGALTAVVFGAVNGVPAFQRNSRQ